MGGETSVSNGMPTPPCHPWPASHRTCGKHRSSAQTSRGGQIAAFVLPAAVPLTEQYFVKGKKRKAIKSSEDRSKRESPGAGCAQRAHPGEAGQGMAGQPPALSIPLSSIPFAPGRAPAAARLPTYRLLGGGRHRDGEQCPGSARLGGCRLPGGLPPPLGQPVPRVAGDSRSSRRCRRRRPAQLPPPPPRPGPAACPQPPAGLGAGRGAQAAAPPQEGAQGGHGRGSAPLTGARSPRGGEGESSREAGKGWGSGTTPPRRPPAGTGRPWQSERCTHSEGCPRGGPGRPQGFVPVVGCGHRAGLLRAKRQGGVETTLSLFVGIVV